MNVYMYVLMFVHRHVPARSKEPEKGPQGLSGDLEPLAGGSGELARVCPVIADCIPPLSPSAAACLETASSG